MSSSVVEQMAVHFGRDDLRDRVADVLRKAGKHAGNTSVEELAGLDQWHVNGLVPTRRLAQLAAISADDKVLDAGCGMGGPARLLAKEHGCFVEGIDMTDSYLETAELMNEITQMSGKVSLRKGDVTDIQFDDDTFDVVWTQHAAQSIPDKQKFFAEAARVLKPGGRFVVHDLFHGAGDPVHFPAFWGQDESISFLITDSAMRDLLVQAGFEIEYFSDTTSEAHEANDAMDEQNAKSELGEPTIEGLDIFLLFGDQTLVMAENSVKDMEVGSVGIFEAVCRLSV